MADNYPHTVWEVRMQRRRYNEALYSVTGVDNGEDLTLVTVMWEAVVVLKQYRCQNY